MKRFIFFLALHVLSVSVFPCCLFDDCTDEQTATDQAANHQSETTECGEACSPFLVCQTCSGFALTQVPIDVTIIPSYSPVISQSLQDVPSSFSHDIWHPPRHT